MLELSSTTLPPPSLLSFCRSMIALLTLDHLDASPIRLYESILYCFVATNLSIMSLTLTINLKELSSELKQLILKC